MANTPQKLRTNPPKFANKQNYEQTGVSDKFLGGLCKIPRRIVQLLGELSNPVKQASLAKAGFGTLEPPPLSGIWRKVQG